jgi:hypothetical protein
MQLTVVSPVPVVPLALADVVPVPDTVAPEPSVPLDELLVGRVLSLPAGRDVVVPPAPLARPPVATDPRPPVAPEPPAPLPDPAASDAPPSDAPPSDELAELDGQSKRPPSHWQRVYVDPALRPMHWVPGSHGAFAT